MTSRKEALPRGSEEDVQAHESVHLEALPHGSEENHHGAEL